MKTKLWLHFSLALCTLVVCDASAATHHVWQGSPTPLSPYATWATAAHSIQEAVDAAAPGDTILVTNGLYATGTRTVGTNLLANRVAVTNAISLQSVNGPQVTIIQGAKAPSGDNGDGAIRCVYLADGASLSGFTLTNGATRLPYDYPDWMESAGGGVRCASSNAVVSNCVLSGNSAYNFAGAAAGGMLRRCILRGNDAAYGGAAAWATLEDCRLEDNTAVSGGAVNDALLVRCVLARNTASSGGGAFSSRLNDCLLHDNVAEVGAGAVYGTLTHCTLTGNQASISGGGAGIEGTASQSLTTLRSCIIYDNVAPQGPNYGQNTRIEYSCTTPLPTNGLANITNPPSFLDPTAGDFRLAEGSPCIDTAFNPPQGTPRDLTGLHRPLDGNRDGLRAPDMGAYEFNPYSLRINPGDLRLTVWGEPLAAAQLQTSSNLIGWAPGSVILFPASGQTFVDPAPTTERHLFYRLAFPPFP